jgi:PAS domain S-box-containing protein
MDTFAFAGRIEPSGQFVCDWLTEGFGCITGYTDAGCEKVGAWSGIIYPDDQSITLRRRLCLAQGQPFVGEYRIVTRSGETRWLREIARPVWDGAVDTAHPRVLGNCQDITAERTPLTH